MGRIDPAKGGEELSGFQLQIERQTGCLQERLLDFDLGLIVIVELENNVGETFEVRIDRAIKRELDVARVETTLLRIVITDFDVIEIARARAGEGIKEAPVPVLEIVSGADETTDVSVVGKDPDVAVPFAFTLGPDGAVGAFDVDETTDASSVAKRVGDAAAATDDASGFGDDEGAVPFAFSIAVC